MPSINDPNLGLDYGWAQGENDWNIGMDNNMRVIGGVMFLYLKSKTQTTPPPSPADGDRYYVPAGATGAWAGNSGNIALWIEGAWLFVPIKLGWHVQVEDESQGFYWYNGSVFNDLVDLDNYVQQDSSYNATGNIDFTGTITWVGTHSANRDEIATLNDIDVAIGSLDLSPFAMLAPDQVFLGNNTFSLPITVADGTAPSHTATVGQLNAVVGGIGGTNLGAGVGVYDSTDINGLSSFKTLLAGSNVSLTDNGNEITINSTASGGGGATTFLNLDDTPVSYTGEAGKVVAVNGTEDGVEFIAAGGGGTSGVTSWDGNDKTANFTTAVNTGYSVGKTLIGAVVVGIPASPSAGDEVMIESIDLSTAPDISAFGVNPMSAGTTVVMRYMTGFNGASDGWRKVSFLPTGS